MLESFSFDKKNRVVIVGVRIPEVSQEEHQASLEEMGLLAKTLNFEVIETFSQSKSRIESDYFIGKGKLEEVRTYINQNTIDAVLFDNELSGIQERNIEKYLNTTIFGRTEVILNIFNRRAKSNEAKLQVQLASLEYKLPRLRNLWDHFSRVEGHIGMRGGEGEKQLELDRRMVKDQITKIKSRLKKIEVQMDNRRKGRKDAYMVSLVGYTNAGKTSLMNLLAKTGLFAENMLFSTLDSTIRKVYINDQLSILLSDTVGFINKLPHHLVVSFKSTLDEIKYSNLILHVIDASSSVIQSNMNSVNRVLDEIGINDIPIIRVFNKIDKLTNTELIPVIHEPGDLFISVYEKKGIDQLKASIEKHFS